MKRYLGVDTGGTAVKIGLVNEIGEILAETEAPVNMDNYRTPIQETVLRTARKALSAWQISAGDLCGIGYSATGQIDCGKGIVAGTCGNLPGWTGQELKKSMEEAFCLPCSVQNDANCMLLGEVFAGAGKGYSDVVGLTIGTGIGGGILSGGRLVTGSSGFAGEIGHIRIHEGTGRTCTCGARGCWEQYASTTALIREAKTINPAWLDGRTFFSAAESGDEEAGRLLDAWIKEISTGIECLVHLFNPELVLIGGGVSAQNKLLIEPLKRRVREHVMPAFAEHLEIRAAALRNSAGLVGAVAWFMQEHSEV